jgi:hypothetical protein
MIETPITVSKVGTIGEGGTYDIPFCAIATATAGMVITGVPLGSGFCWKCSVGSETVG